MRSLIVILSVQLFMSVALGAQESGQNAYDPEGRKTGYWIVDGSVKPTPGYSRDQIVEEGEYQANKKQGLWKYYHSNGKIKSEIHYKNNVPKGAYKLYFENGVLEEQGNWSYNKNTGDFLRNHPNGQPAQLFRFDKNGVRNGVQKYFHENGKLELQVQIVNGKEEGELKRYYANGDLKESKTFTEGVVEAGTTQTFAMKAPKVKVETFEPVAEKVSKKVTTDKPNISVFKDTGNNTLYNKDKLVSQIGYFKNGRLWDGKWYRYDSNGLLETIEVYKEGRLSGYAPLPAN